MFNTPNAVKTLRRHWKRKDLPNPALLAKELHAESDRAAVVLSSAILDDALTYRLINAFSVKPTDDEIDYIFRFEGPLGSFSSKIEIAYLFGCIDDNTRSQLNDIREMRNACAHTKQIISFELPELANVAKRLFHPRGLVVSKLDTREQIRRAFIIEVLAILSVLVEGSREKGHATVAEVISALQAPSPDK
jgi:hypothetical protein